MTKAGSSGMSSSASDVVTGKPFGRYVLERPLASGGMGQLFIGIMPGPAGFERRVAIKRILPHLCGSDEFVRRFIDEARIVVQLQHGNIVPVFEMGVEGDEYYIAMEYLPGWDLKAVLQRCREAGSSFPVPLALLLGIEVARGLAYAHRKTDEQGRELSIIHRDVSPSNILLGRDGVVKITDFGIAKAASKMVDSITGMLRGKFGYMSPEQASGNDLDRRSDIFSLGVVLWEVLVGRRLFDAESDTAILRKIQACEVTPPSACRSDVPIEVDVPIMRCLVRDRRQRFSFAEELEQELTALLVRLYTGTGASSLAAFLLDLFPEERRKATPAVGASFDDLLRAGLEQLSEVDVHGPTLDVGPLAARPRPEQSRDEPAGRAGAPSPGSGRETRQAGGLPPAAAGGSLPEIDWTAMSAGAAVPWQVHEPLSTPAIPLPGPVSGSWPSPAGREVTAARQPLSWRWRAAVAGIAAGLLALGAGGAWLAARLSGEGWGSLQVQTRPGGA
ncbi:MAG: hypothetical protein FJ125_15100, partial [Deltaproteobacteria bacterium]|nr:hypothetical protein [Deltaproteobacteria bacterium]